MSGTCTYEVHVDEKGAFQYFCTQHTKGLQVDAQGDLNVSGLQMVELILEMTGPAQFDGFLVEKDKAPSLQRGWTSKSTLEGFGITPLEPSVWPDPDSPFTCSKLRFMLNIEAKKHVYHFRLVAKQGDRVFTYDPKIYNDPPTEPPPPLEEISDWLRDAARLGKKAQAWLRGARG